MEFEGRFGEYDFFSREGLCVMFIDATYTRQRSQHLSQPIWALKNCASSLRLFLYYSSISSLKEVCKWKYS